MQLNEFEKHIANNIDSYKSEINTDSLWGTLEKDLVKKKRKRHGIFLLLALLSISVLCYIGWSTFQPENGNNNRSTSSKVEEILPINQLRTNKELESTGLDNNKSKNEVNIGSDLNRETQTAQYNQNITTATTIAGIRISQTKATSIAHDGLMPNFINLKSIPTSQTYLRNTIDKRKEVNQPKLIPAVNNSKINMKNIKNLDRLDFIPNIALNVLELEKPTVKLNNRQNLIPIKQWRLFLNPQAGIYYTDRKIAINNVIGESLRDYRSDSEQTLETLSLGVAVELQHESDIYINGGINLNQSTVKFFNQSSKFTIESIEYVQETNFLTNGVIEEVLGMFDQRQETIRKTTAYNTLRWAELTLGGGYRFTKSKWQVGTGLGMMYGGMLNAKGMIFDANKNIIEIQNQAESIYNSNLGLGGYTNLEIRYVLQPKISLSSQLGYRFYRNSVTKSSYPLNITYQWWGASIGLNYQIF